MKKNQGRSGSREEGMELKYCERGGGLWLREVSCGQVYCENCRPEIAELPIPKQSTAKAGVPYGQAAGSGDYEFEDYDVDAITFEAAGGVA